MMKTTVYSPFDYVTKAMDNNPKPLTREMFDSLLNDMGVKMTTEKVREHGPEADRYKRMLPGICWQSKFNGGLRTDMNAESSGFFCLDIDYHHDPHFIGLCKTEGEAAAWRWGEALARENAKRWAEMQAHIDEKPRKVADGEENDLGIVAIHVSPQNAGVHVVACCSPLCESIEENQARLARLLGTEYDHVCKDWARIFFVTPREDWTYLDMETLFGEN